MESSVSSKAPRSIRVALVAGEESGDILGSGLMRALKQRAPSVTFEGVGGQRMQAQGFRSEFPMERLSVMGLVEVLRRFPELYRRRQRLIQAWIANPPDLFIGIDAPDFNLTIEERLRAVSVPTVHYVSPSVWAWRQKRLKKIERAVDLMLCFLPFEAQFYRNTSVDARFIGHPLANQLPLSVTQAQARSALGLDPEGAVVVLMPGSRSSEVERLTEPFLQTAQWLAERRPDLQFVIPAANEARYHQIAEIIGRQGLGLRLVLTRGDSQTVLTASDAVLIASGTATLETLLCNKPMVVAYKMATLTFRIMARLVKSKYISLPNLLADEALVPEVLQQDVCAATLGPLMLRAIDDQAYRHYLRERFAEIAQLLRQDADAQAAQAVIDLLKARGVTIDH